MIDACAEGSVYLHDAGLGEDVHPLVTIPLRGFSYSRYILLRSERELPLRAFREFLLSRRQAKG